MVEQSGAGKVVMRLFRRQIWTATHYTTHTYIEINEHPLTVRVSLRVKIDTLSVCICELKKKTDCCSNTELDM